MFDACVALSRWDSLGVWSKPRARRRLDALVIAGLLLWGIFAVALEGKALTIAESLPQSLAGLERMDPTTLLTCTGAEFCESGSEAFAQHFEATITLPPALGERDLLLVFAGFFAGSVPPTCNLSGHQRLGATIRAGSVSNASLVDVTSPAGPGTPLCDSYGPQLQALLLEGAPGEKLTVDFVVDVDASTPAVARLAVPVAGFALTIVPEPDSVLLLALGLFALRMGVRSTQGHRT